MKTSRHTIIIIVVLVIIALLTGWFYDFFQGDTNDTSDKQQSQQQAITIIKDFEITELDQAGRIKYRIQAEHMQQYVDDPMQLLSPRMDFYPQDMMPYHIRAQQGQIEGNNNNVVLKGQVYIVNKPDTKIDTMRIETEYLSILPNEKYASTDRKIHYYGHQTEIHAFGMQFDLNNEKLTLLANVHTTYYPDTTKD